MTSQSIQNISSCFPVLFRSHCILYCLQSCSHSFSAFMFHILKWLPLFQENRLLAGEMILPVMMEPPPDNYSYITPDVLLPGTKWVDNHKGIFTVHLEAVTSVHTQVLPLLRYCFVRSSRQESLLYISSCYSLRAAVALSGKEVLWTNLELPLLLVTREFDRTMLSFYLKFFLFCKQN